MNTKPKSPLYFPIDRGLYEVAPGLRPLGFDLGQGEWDQKIFQIDEHFEKFRANKLLCRNERLSKYEVRKGIEPKSEKVLAQFLKDRFLQDHPEYFKKTISPLGEVIECSHTGDVITLSAEGELLAFEARENLEPSPSSALDALAMQVPEDITLLQRRNGEDSLSYLHLCSPSHWAAEDKAGLSFVQIHNLIPHIEKINRAAANMVEAMINKGPFVRFVWSFVTDQRLNHHPVPPLGIDPDVWKGRSFAKEKASPFDFRVERQVVYGLPAIEASLFTIRVSFIEGQAIKDNERQRSQLLSALRSMSPESRIYKGVSHCFDELTAYLAT